MGNDIVAYRITIGLFYHKTSLGCLRKTVYRYCFSLNDMLAELIKMISRFKLCTCNLYRTCSNLIAFYLLLLCLLLICGDIEPNPGPERTHEYSEKTLSIFHCNIRSLRNKLNYIADIIEDYDVVFFTETHLDSNITDDDISIMGFQVPVRKDRNSHGGGDLNKNFMSDLPSNIRDVIFINGLINIIDKATHFDTRTSSSSLLDPILVTDSIPVLDKDTIPIDRCISDHEGTYVTIDCGFSKKDVTIRCDDKVWFDSNLRRETRKRDRLRKFFIRSSSTSAEHKYKQQRNKVNNLKKQAKKHFYATINENLDELKVANSKQYWKTINMLIKSDRPTHDIPPLRDPDQNFNLAYEGTEKSEILNKYFCSISNLDDANKDLPEFDDRCHDFLSQIIVSEQDVLDIVSTLDANKAVGPDIVSNRMLLAVRNEISKPLLRGQKDGW
ncbi:unnamed protein product [Mytilus coruscus]|uniref:Endonuclease/exonuclease/phosphatase domain-containing protein n=1 Tax=Mytilus coruscus TaxID=42192 RepID=A0A6J8CYM9_MYTCO|nr:unnamed protein product [Mytilus coruscus]